MAKSKAQNTVVYPAVFTYEPGEQIAVSFPDIDAVTCGVDEEDALASARDLLGLMIYSFEDDNEPIPEPTKLQDVKTAPNERAVLVDAYMPAVRLAQENRAVSRTVTLPAWLNAKAVERGVNFSQTLQQALREQLNV